MFSAETDKAAGIPVVNEPYPEGEAGIQKSLAMICKKVREGAATAVMKSYAGNVLKQAGFPKSNEDRAAVFLAHVRQNVAYAHDALGTEQIQSAQVSLCVEGAPICIPIGDCFPAGTLLLRSDYSLVPIEKIRIGERIWGRDGWTAVQSKAFKGPKSVDVLALNNGSQVPLTTEHKVYVARCDRHANRETSAPCQCPIEECRIERIRVADVQEKDRLIQPKRIAFGKEEPDVDRAYIEGLYVSDGWAEDGRFAISGQDGCPKEEQKRAVKEACERLGVDTYWARKYIRINDAEWTERIALMGTHAPEKHLLSINFGEAGAAATLRGVMADSGANTNGGRTFTTTSKQLMVQTRVLHRMFGISCSSRFIEDHGGLGKNPIWRLGVREPSQKAEKILRVKSVERSVYEAPCYDIQTEDHYVYLPEHDVTVSNCDDLVTALATLCAACGMEVAVVRQFFGAGHQQHVLVEVRGDSGKWFPLDPSSSTMPAGTKAKAAKETRSSPWDESITGLSADAQFIGIGSLPVFIYGKEGWRQVREFEGLGHADDAKRWYSVGSGVEAPIPAGKVILWEGGWWFRDPATNEVFQWTCCGGCAKGKGCKGESGAAGLPEETSVALVKVGAGALKDDVAAALLTTNPANVVKQFWAQLQGRTWQQAISAADARAAGGKWPSQSLDARADLVSLAMSSAINAKAVAPIDPRAADALNRTWLLLLRKINKEPKATDVPALQSRLGAVEVPIGVIIAAIFAQALLLAAIYIAIFYFASQVIDDVLSKIECEREMLRLHAAWDKIVDKHLQDHSPYSPDELKILDQLEQQQTFVAAGCTKRAPGVDWWPIGIGVGLVSIAVLGVTYRKEIGGWIQDRRGR